MVARLEYFRSKFAKFGPFSTCVDRKKKKNYLDLGLIKLKIWTFQKFVEKSESTLEFCVYVLTDNRLVSIIE